MIIRGAMGRKLPFGRVEVGDCLFFTENNGEGLVKAKANVQHVYNSCHLTVDESKQMVDSFNDKLLLDSGLKKRFRGKRYLVLITVDNFEEIEPFSFDRSAFANMDDWLPVIDVEKVSLSSKSLQES